MAKTNTPDEVTDQGKAGTDATKTNAAAGTDTAGKKGSKKAAKKPDDKAELTLLTEAVKAGAKTCQFIPATHQVHIGNKITLATSQGTPYAKAKVKSVRELLIDTVGKTIQHKTAEVRWEPLADDEMKKIIAAHGESSANDFFSNITDETVHVKLVEFSDAEML